MPNVLIVPDVLIVIEAVDGRDLTLPSMAACMVDAVKRSISSTPQTEGPGSILSVGVETSVGLAEKLKAGAIALQDTILCPLTFNLPETLPFPGKAVYRLCQNISGLRQQVAQQFKCPIGEGQYWLPIIVTAKGSLYAEVIAKPLETVIPSTGAGRTASHLDEAKGSYIQPLHLSDIWRQRLYNLGHQLVRSLDAPPATYLMQFGFLDNEICFDRLFPFPAEPAIASLSTQTPDLFACHWYCLAGKAIVDITIDPSVPYQVYPG